MSALKRHLCCAALATVYTVAQAAHSFAAGFEVRPLLVETTDGTGSLSISNPGDARVYIEAAIFKWRHNVEGVDALDALPDAVVSPPATWLDAGAEYRIRFKVPKAASGAESAYRVILTQVPSRDDIASGRVVFAVTQSIPIFAEPDSMRPPSLTASLAGPNRLVIRNDGGRRLRLTHLTQDGQVLLDGLAGYALGSSTLTVNLAAPAHPGRIDLSTDLGPRSVDVKE